MAKKMVWILMITHRHGTDLYAFQKGGSAKTKLLNYAKEWWDSDGPGANGDALPKKSSEIIERYFKHAGDKSESEYYLLRQEELQ